MYFRHGIDVFGRNVYLILPRAQINGYSRKHPYHPHGGNRKLTPLPPSDVLIHLLLSETIFSLLPSGQQKFPLWGEYGSFLERPNASQTANCEAILNITKNCKAFFLKVAKLNFAMVELEFNYFRFNSNVSYISDVPHASQTLESLYSHFCVLLHVRCQLVS